MQAIDDRQTVRTDHLVLVRKVFWLKKHKINNKHALNLFWQALLHVFTVAFSVKLA